MKRRLSVWLTAGILVFGASACGRREISEHQRKQAEHLASEADFAMTLRDWARAESVLAQVVELAPDNGAYWISLGSMRMRLGNRDGARAAYRDALKAFEAESKEAEAGADPWMQQVYVLALLGRHDDARAMLEKTARRFPESRTVRGFIEGKRLEAMLQDPKFKELAL